MTETSRADGTTPRVLLVCPVGGEIGGAEQVMLALARELPKHGYLPSLVAMRPGRLADVARSQGTEAFVFPRPHQYRNVGVVMDASRWLGSLMAETGAELMHATHTAHLYAWLAGRRMKKPEIWHVHDLPSRRDAVGQVTNRMMPAFTIFTTDRVACAYPRLRHGANEVIPPSCVEPERLRSRSRRPDIRARLMLPDGPILLTVARLQEHKGHETLLQASAMVMKTRPDAVFAIAGTARNLDQERYRERLRSLANRNGMGGQIVFLDHVDDEDLAELYRQSTALVHPAWSEGYGLVLLEAMSMMLPVIAASASGPEEIIQDGQSGLLTPVRNAEALADRILRVLEDDKLRERLRAGGTLRAKHLTLEDMTASVASVYREVLGRSA